MNNSIYLVCIILAGLIILALLFRLFMLKSNIRQMKEELKNTRDESYNRQIKMMLTDKDLEALGTEINKCLDYQKHMKMESEKNKRQLEQSISDIAHDLRTPLTVVKGNLQMLEKEELSEKGREYLSISRNKAETLKGMVDEFFELSVLESDSKPVELCKLDIITFLSEFIIENEALINEHELTPEITFPEKAVFAQANKAMLTRVFSNLMGNIFKYAKESFKLTVKEDASDSSLNPGNDICRIIISNHVNDPDSIDIEHIFDRTYRADKARSDGSAGLGLYIAKLLIEKQKGIITAQLSDSQLEFIIELTV